LRPIGDAHTEDNFQIGNRPVANASWFGLIDEVVVSSDAFSQAEVTALQVAVPEPSTWFLIAVGLLYVRLRKT